MGKGKTFNVQDKVFAKVRGFPAWPARVEKVEDAKKPIKYHIFFFGTYETAVMKNDTIWSYAENKESMGQPKKHRLYNEGLWEIENNFNVKPVKGQESDQQKKTASQVSKIEVKPVKRKAPVDQDEPEKKKKKIEFPLPPPSPDVEIHSRSGRKIKPKRFADDDELVNKSYEAIKVVTTSPKEKPEPKSAPTPPPQPTVKPSPIVVKPVVTKPVVSKPVVSKPVVTKPPVIKPPVIKPAVTKPAVAKPAAVKPAAAKPLPARKEVVQTKEPVKEETPEAAVMELDEDTAKSIWIRSHGGDMMEIKYDSKRPKELSPKRPARGSRYNTGSKSPLRSRMPEHFSPRSLSPKSRSDVDRRSVIRTNGSKILLSKNRTTISKSAVSKDAIITSVFSRSPTFQRSSRSIGNLNKEARKVAGVTKFNPVVQLDSNEAKQHVTRHKTSSTTVKSTKTKDPVKRNLNVPEDSINRSTRRSGITVDVPVKSMAATKVTIKPAITSKPAVISKPAVKPEPVKEPVSKRDSMDVKHLPVLEAESTGFRRLNIISKLPASTVIVSKEMTQDPIAVIQKLMEDTKKKHELEMQVLELQKEYWQAKLKTMATTSQPKKTPVVTAAASRATRGDMNPRRSIRV